MNIPSPEEAQSRFLDSIYKTCISRANVQVPYDNLDSGTRILSDEAECDRYIALFGGHHFHKLYAAFASTNFRYTEGKNLEIIDWGCGQALATCILVDYLIENRISPNVMSITLIEPSLIALERGFKFIQQMFQNNLSIDSVIRIVRKSINDLDCSDLATQSDNLKLHLFSNIIDIEAINLNNLYTLMTSSFKV